MLTLTDATKTFRIQTLTAKIIDFSDSNLIWAILWVFEWQIIETSYENKVESTQFSDSNDVICKNILLQTIFIFKFKVLNIFRQFLSKDSVLYSFRKYLPGLRQSQQQALMSCWGLRLAWSAVIQQSITENQTWVGIDLVTILNDNSNWNQPVLVLWLLITMKDFTPIQSPLESPFNYTLTLDLDWLWQSEI